MNHLCYKTIFSKHLGTLVAVGEHACSQSKGQGASAGTRAAAGILDARFVGMLALGFAWVSLAWSQTLPQGPQVAQGVVSFSQSAKQMDITQSTAKAVVNWQSFDIGQNAKVNITQPSSQSVLLNRVLSDNPTQILGQLQANGQVVLVNPKGIVVGSDGSVSASAFTASTLNISDADFMAGNGRYTRNGSTGQVINKGRIEVAPGGYVALLGASVSNEGQIIAPQGGVALGAAETVTVPIGRTGKIKLELTPASINASVTNQKDGVIVAEGGQVYMQAAALGQAVASVLNSGSIDTSGVQAGAVHVLADGGQIKVDGRITANSSGQDDQGQQRKGGDIFIGRDEATGVLAKATDVSGAKLESAKGFVETSGDVLSTTGTRVKASEWLLDPYNITIAAGAATGTNYNSHTSGADSTILASDISANLTAGTSVTIATGAGGTSAGFIAVNESIAKTGGVDATLTLQAHSNITVAANKTITSNTGKLNVVFNSDSDGTNGGGIVLNSGSGITSNGGNITLGGGIAGNGSGFAIADGSSALQGIALQTATISAGGGNIVMNGLSATTSATAVVGISMSGGTITTTGAGQITLTGKNQLTGTTGATGTGFSMSSGTITGGSTGAVTIEGNSSTSSVTSTNNKGAIINGTVTSTGGDISITGIGGAGAQYDNGVDIGGSVLGVGSANISITGTAASGSVGDNVGVTTSGTATISSVNGNINITGTGGTGNGARIRNHGVSVGSSNAIQSTGSGSITVTGRAINTDNGYSQGVVISTGGLRTNTGNIKVDARVPQNYQVAASITAAIASTSGNVYVRSAGGKITNSSTGTISGNNVSIENTNGSIDANGVITIGAGGASSWSGVISQIGIDLGGSVTATNNLNVYGNQTGFDAGVKMSGATTTVSGKNVTLYGKSSTSNGVLLSGATLSGQYIKATGATNTGTAGFAWQGGKINTTGTAGTSTASVVKGISAASGNTLGFGAFMMIANSTTNAASGTSLTFAGEAT
ncbi:MAG: filamentous hemagglutinin N-terminal domain-containing protein, partial [Limnohabitans sp.]|nr:filamentous hemagglutinin N-terminal domain-containing protein [Limnohabitans sp.]